MEPEGLINEVIVVGVGEILDPAGRNHRIRDADYGILKRPYLHSSPRNIDDPANGGVADLDPISGTEGTFQVKNYARENIRQVALERQTDDHGHYTRCGDQSGHILLQDVSENSNHGHEINRGRHKTPNDLRYNVAGGFLQLVPDEAIYKHVRQRRRYYPPQPIKKRNQRRLGPLQRRNR